jgi:secreted Zn-dependent insulinase-like peptidase
VCLATRTALRQPVLLPHCTEVLCMVLHIRLQSPYSCLGLPPVSLYIRDTPLSALHCNLPHHAPAGLTAQQVQGRFATMQGRLLQALTNWANNNPAQHAEYGSHHLLQQRHHHNAALLQATAAAAPAQLLALQQQLASGRELHVDMLAYGNVSQQEAAEVVRQLQQQLKPQGLPVGCWPPAGKVLCLSPPAGPQLEAAAIKEQQGGRCSDAAAVVQQPWGLAAAAAAEGLPEDQLQRQQPTHAPNSTAAAAANSCAAVYVTHLPANPNPSNSNSAVYYTVQLGPDNIGTAVLLDLFVQMSSKACFYELRTRQRLGYSVILSSSSLHRQLGLMVRVQSPSTQPDALAAAVRAWLAGWRKELEEMAVGEVLVNQKKVMWRMKLRWLGGWMLLHPAMVFVIVAGRVGDSAAGDGRRGGATESGEGELAGIICTRFCVTCRTVMHFCSKVCWRNCGSHVT